LARPNGSPRSPCRSNPIRFAKCSCHLRRTACGAKQTGPLLLGLNLCRACRVTPRAFSINPTIRYEAYRISPFLCVSRKKFRRDGIQKTGFRIQNQGTRGGRAGREKRIVGSRILCFLRLPWRAPCSVRETQWISHVRTTSGTIVSIRFVSNIDLGFVVWHVAVNVEEIRGIAA
jgi:hypothetical protein